MDYTDDLDIDAPWCFHRECIDSNSVEDNKVPGEGNGEKYIYRIF